ncbi:hypothetical protein SKAU_G00356440 [Synaphobranchus kaupii]|uniref:Uncharacterized protein n=1 Tax=Synaphobranchus kaupii TaxID=118154 RepID=A0A9Q1EHE4_SYNKA|nr:hypothetical protein SKAU_G00356440 [Synaphobranchus kaupii]
MEVFEIKQVPRAWLRSPAHRGWGAHSLPPSPLDSQETNARRSRSLPHHAISRTAEARGGNPGAWLRGRGQKTEQSNLSVTLADDKTHTALASPGQPPIPPRTRLAAHSFGWLSGRLR